MADQVAVIVIPKERHQKDSMTFGGRNHTGAGVIQMTINIEALIRSLDKPYQQIRDAGIITYKTLPQGTQCDSFLELEMKKEGVFLAFDNDSKSFKKC